MTCLGHFYSKNLVPNHGLISSATVYLDHDKNH